MKRRFLLFAILMIVAAWGKTYAQNSGPEDITDQYLKDADLKSLDGWTQNGYTAWVTDGAVPVIEFWNWSNEFSFTQTITLPAGDYRLAVNSFYRESSGGNGTNNDRAWIFAGDKKQNVVALNSMDDLSGYAGNNDLYRAATAFSQDKFSNEFDFTIAEDNTEITLGFKGTSPNNSWCILGPVKLYKYSLEAFIADYQAKLDIAEGIVNKPMNKDVKDELVAAMVDPLSFTLSSQVTAAKDLLVEKINAANASIANYEKISAYLTYTQENVSGDYSAISTKISNGVYTEVNPAIVEIRNVRNGIIFQSATPDMSKLIDNAGFELGNTNYWTVGASSDTGARSTTNDTYSMSNSEGNYLFNTWWKGIPITQDVGKLPEGQYMLSAVVASDGARIYMLVNGNHERYMDTSDKTAGLTLNYPFTLTAEQEVTIGVVGSNNDEAKSYVEDGYWWYKADNFKLVQYIPVTAITASDVTVEKANTVEIGASITPENATLPTITYVSDDESIATVDADGVVTGVDVGTTTITMTTEDVTKVINVTVTEPAILPQSITVDPASVQLQLGGTTTAKLTATVVPEEANQEVEFASSDETVATVDAEGNVNAVGIGTATITVKSKAKEDVSATVSVTVSTAAVPNQYSTEIADDTDYWLYNAATGKYLGGANSWGTRASIIEHGIPFKFVEAGEGVYTLDSYTRNNNDAKLQYLAGEWIDGSATNITFTKNDNGTFSMKIGDNYLKAKSSNTEVDLNGTDAADPYAQWYLLSLDDRETSMKALKDKDATFYIKDFNFSRNNTQFSEWSFETFGGNNQKNNAGDNSNFCVESFHTLFNMSQTLIVPNGTYKLTAQGFYRQDGNDNENLPMFFANDETAPFPLKTGTENDMTAASNSFSAGLYKIDPITVTVTDRTLKIGAKNDTNTSLWCIWDNFELEAVEISDQQDVPVIITPAGYATLYYSNLNLAVPTDVKAYTATVNGKKITLSDIGTVIPAGTAVVIESEKELTENKTFYFPLAEAPSATVEKGDLEGTDEETTISEEGYKYYVLSLVGGDASTIGFYWDKNSTEGTSVNNKAHKAYLKVEIPKAGGTSAYLFDTTGIRSINATEGRTGQTYTISGVRINGDNLQKGLYIIDGKKIVIK